MKSMFYNLRLLGAMAEGAQIVNKKGLEGLMGLNGAMFASEKDWFKACGGGVQYFTNFWLGKYN